MTGFSACRRIRPLALLPVVLVLVLRCAYFNTFYNAKTYYKEGLNLKEQKQVVQAKSKFDKSVEKSALVISRWPGSRWVDDATFLIGMCYYQMGHYGKAVRHFEQLVLAFPNSGLVSQAQLYRGLALLKGKEYGVAAVVLDDVRSKYPRLRDVAAFHLAEAFFAREDYSRAIDSLSSFVEQFPRSHYVQTAVRYLAEAGFKLEHWDEAEHWYNRYVRFVRDPRERTRAKLKVAACRFAQGNYEQAADQVGDVLGRYSELDDEANLLLGRCLAELGRDKEALETWTKVRGSSGLGAEAFFRIGKYHEELKDFGTARAHYDTAKSRRANSDYGVLAVKRLSLLDAFSEQDSVEREPAEAMFLLAEVHNLNLAEYDEAMRLYQTVYDSFPDSKWAPKGLFAKAWILKNVENDTIVALTLAGRIISEYPDTDYADESRRWLGLPVPKRKPKKPEPEPESVAVKADTAKPVPEPGPLEEELELAREDEVEPEAVPAEPDTGELTSEPGPKEEEPELAMGDRPESEPGPETRRRIDKAVGELEEIAAPEPGMDTTAKPETAKKPDFGLEIVHFDFDKRQIRPDDAEALKRDAALLLGRPEVKLEIVGHCDPRGTDEYNLGLGLKRAEAVRDFLSRAGVARNRLSVRSEGERRPISTSPDEYWLDRRVEFKVR